jgi:hypothetical protein
MPNSSHWPRAEPIEVADTHDEATASNERRLDVPDWIRSLRDIHFARAHVDDPEEGAIISVCVWFVHGHTEESCLHPKVVRLDADQFSWRSTMVVAWLDSIRRAQPIDFHVVTPLPPDVHGTSPDVHVILSQQLFADQRAILVTAGIPDTEFPGKQRAAIVTGQVAAMDIRSVMPSALRTFGILQVSQGDHVFPEEQSFRVANGDSFVLSIAPVGSGRAGQAPPALPDEEVEDETLLLQLATFLGPVEPKADPTPAFHVSPPSLVAGDLSSKVVLSLDACVAVPATYRPDAFHGAEIAYCTRDDWPNQIAGTQIQLSSLPEGLDLTAHTLFAMSCPEHSCEPELAHKVALYVDGSVCAGHAAWSVVAVRYDAVGAPALQGCLSGTVPTSTECPQWIGAQSEDNISAELTAVVAAMVAAFCMDSGESIVVRPDLKLSVKLATLEWQCSAHPELGRLCQVLGAWFYKIHGSFCEVRGHTKHPWNDLADSLARWSAMSQLQCGDIDWLPFHELICSHDVNWAWLLNACPSLHQCLPPGSAGGSWQITPSYRRTSMPQFLPPDETWIQFDFCLASANVLALSDELPDMPASIAADRAVRLDRQWHAQKLVAVGLQESRRPAGKIMTEHYQGFASGYQQCGKALHFGCELWLHKTIPLDADRQLTLSAFSSAIAVADPRRLVVNLHHPLIDISFVVLHVPCKSSSCSLDQLEAWWKETIYLLQHASLAPYVWCMVDANAPLASHSTPWFDMHGAEPSNPQGQLFEEALSSLQWYAPATMQWAQKGPHCTWTHPRGKQFRRDFVLCSAAAFSWCTNTWVDQRFDGGFAHDDHFPVVMACQGWLKSSPGARKTVWDPLAFVDPVKKKQFQDALQTMPIPDWSTHVDNHAALLEANVLQLAKQHFQKTSRDRMRPRLSESTCNFISFKRSCLDYGRSQQLMTDKTFRAQLKGLEKETRQRVRHDQRQFYAGLVHDLGKAGELQDARHVYKLLSRLGGRSPKRTSANALPLLKQNGAPVTSFPAQQRLWMKQFAAVEAANIMSRDEFSRLLPACLGIDPRDLAFEVFPDVHEVMQQIHRAKRGKAPGPDGIPPDVLKAGAQEMAKHLVVLTTKVAAHGREPASWRTGRLVPLHKGKLERSDPTGYRSIFLNNFTAKIYHSTIRKHLVQAWYSVMANLQLGGRKGLGCDSAHHLVQAHIAHCSVSKHPGAVLFVDLKAAFYTVLRQGLFPQDMDATAFMIAMHRMGVHPQQVATLLEHAQSESAIRNISPHAMLLVKDVLQATCFEMDGLSEVAATTRGTRPGDPIGDVAFNIVMAALLADVTKMLSATHAVWEGAPTLVSDFCATADPHAFAWAEVAYVDDLAVLMRSPDNESLVHFAKQATTAVWQAAHRRGLELTIGDGKTELLWALRGEGKKRILQETAVSGNSIAVHLPDPHLSLQLPVVLSYKHLGTWVQNDAKPLRAIRSRISAAKQAWAPLVRPFLSKKGILLRTKLQVFESLVLSRFLFNAHTWSLVLPSQLAEWAAGLRPMLYSFAKPLLRGQAPFSFDVDILCGVCELLAPMDLLHVARLRYFKRMLDHCPTTLWQMLKATAAAEGSWLDHLRGSFQWLCRFSHAKFGLSAESGLDTWCSFVSIDARWKGRIKRAMHSCRRYRHEQAKATVWNAWLQGSLARHGVEVVASSGGVQSAQWQCLQCEQLFSSRRALAMHSAKRHGYKTLVKHFAVDGTCPNCARVFHSRVRLCCHLRTATVCLERIRASFPPLSVDTMKTLDATDREHAHCMHQQGWLASKAKLPALRGQGPSLPPAGSPEAALMLNKWSSRVDVETNPAYDALEGICLQQGDQSPRREHEPDVAPADEQMAFVMHSAGGNEHGHGGRFSLHGLARLYATLHIRTLCFIHMFSGFRRQGDLQHCVERHCVQGIHHVFCISVDFCLQGSDGDLSSSQNLAFWKRQVSSGAVFGMGGGPPCETFSAARFLEGGPPPLRSYDEPWGLSSNSQRQWDQVALGSSLLRFMLEMLFHCALAGACGFLEHPAFPVWVRSHRPASTWALTAVRWLRRLHCVSAVTFDQCLFQCEGKNPRPYFW